MIDRKTPGLEDIIGKSWILNGKSIFIKKYKELSTGLFCVFTDKKIQSIPVDQIEQFLESLGAYDALRSYLEHKNKPAAKPKIKKQILEKPIDFHTDLEVLLQEVVMETYCTEYRMNNTGTQWKIYIIKTKVVLSANTLQEVLQMLLNELSDNRSINPRYFIKNQKLFTYG